MPTSSQPSHRKSLSPDLESWEVLDIEPGSFMRERPSSSAELDKKMSTERAEPSPDSSSSSSQQLEQEPDAQKEQEVNIPSDEEQKTMSHASESITSPPRHMSSGQLLDSGRASNSAIASSTGDNALQSTIHDLEASDFVQDQMVSSQDSITVSIDSKDDVMDKISSSLPIGQGSKSETDDATSEEYSLEQQTGVEEQDYDSKNVTVGSASVADFNEDDLTPISPTLTLGEDSDVWREKSAENESIASEDSSPPTSKEQINAFVENQVSRAIIRSFVSATIDDALSSVEETRDAVEETVSSVASEPKAKKETEPETEAADVVLTSPAPPPVVATPPSPKKDSPLKEKVTEQSFEIPAEVEAFLNPSSPHFDLTLNTIVIFILYVFYNLFIGG